MVPSIKDLPYKNWLERYSLLSMKEGTIHLRGLRNLEETCLLEHQKEQLPKTAQEAASNNAFTGEIYGVFHKKV